MLPLSLKIIHLFLICATHFLNINYASNIKLKIIFLYIVVSIYKINICYCKNISFDLYLKRIKKYNFYLGNGGTKLTLNLNYNYAHSPEDIQHYDTEKLRKEFLITNLFTPGDINLTYTYNDRMIFGGITPTKEDLEITLAKELGVNFFLERRELGVINIGGEGTLSIDGQKEVMVKYDGYYIGKDAKHVVFSSADEKNPAKFYVVSTPAHKHYPNKKLPFKDAISMPMGDQEHMNKRTIYKYIDASQMNTCQLQMGYTVLEPGSGWNTMPAHTHARRMETYMYFDFTDPNMKVFHFLGKPNETRHIVVENEQAIPNPSWSIHCGVGTSSYSFIWAMCGENQTYDDMDQIPMDELK